MKIIKLIENYLILKTKHPHSLIIIKSGIFYLGFNNDAKVMAYLFNYKIKKGENYLLIGFPTAIIDKITKKFNELKLAYIIVNNGDTYVSKSNQLTTKKYKRLVNQSAHIYQVTNQIEDIYEKLNNLKNTTSIKRIINQINKII